jgi:hypothetical protein
MNLSNDDLTVFYRPKSMHRRPTLQQSPACVLTKMMDFDLALNTIADVD